METLIYILDLTPTPKFERNPTTLTAPFQLLPEQLRIRTAPVGLHQVLDQLDGSIVGFVQFVDNEEEISVQRRPGDILPKYDWKVHGDSHNCQRKWENLQSDRTG